MLRVEGSGRCNGASKQAGVRGRSTPVDSQGTVGKTLKGAARGVDWSSSKANALSTSLLPANSSSGQSSRACLAANLTAALPESTIFPTAALSEPTASRPQFYPS